MPAVLADKVKPGMKLCQALYAEDGKVYLPAGTVIDEKLLVELGRSGYKYLRVDSTSLSRNNIIPSAGNLEEQLEERFSRVDLCPFLRLVKKTIKAGVAKGSQEQVD
jgi:hypothetical protein